MDYKLVPFDGSMTELNSVIKRVMETVEDLVADVYGGSTCYTVDYESTIEDFTKRYAKGIESHSLYGKFPCKRSEYSITADWSELLDHMHKNIMDIAFVFSDGTVSKGRDYAFKVDGFTIINFRSHTWIVRESELEETIKNL